MTNQVIQTNGNLTSEVQKWENCSKVLNQKVVIIIKDLIGNAKALVEIFSKHYINIDATTLRIAPKNSGNQIPWLFKNLSYNRLLDFSQHHVIKIKL